VETFFGNFRIPLPNSPALTIHAGYIDFLYLNANNELRLFDFKSSKLDTYAEEIKQFNLVQLFLYREALKRALASGDFSFFAKPAHQNASSPANSANRIVNYLDKNFMERLHRDPPQGIHADYASHRKKFFMVPIPETLAFTPEEDSYNFISELLARIGDGKKFLPKKSSQCPYCAYYNFCPESELSSIDTGNFSARGLRFSERSIDAGKFQLNMKPANGPESSQAQDKKVLIRFNPESSRSIRALDKNIIISAGAGAGKTELLSARYLYLLLHDDKITVENIACITFTNKAVGEMKKRILEKIHTSLESRIKPVILDDTRDYALSERQYQKLLAAKESFFEKSRILTFHSFCQENIAEYARFSHDFDHYDLESEIAPLYLVEDEKIIYLKSLARRGFAEIFQKENFSKREVNFFLDWFRNENLYYEFDAASGGLIRDILTLLDKINLSGRGFAEWQYSYRDFLENYRLLLEKEKNSYLTLCRQLEDFVNRNAAPAKKPQLILKIRQHQFANLSASFREPELKEEVKNLLEQKEENLFYTQVVKGLEHLAPENIPFTDLAKHLQLGREYAINKALFHIAQGVQEHLEEFKRENGYLEQSDLHLRFLKLMQDKTMGEKIQKLLRQKFRYIMVDEFQDTNWLQERILGKLHEEEKNFLFLVGDMKQSIYRFQQCDDQIFQKYIQRCQTRSNYHYLSLRENYRSRKQIVQFNNHFFSKNKLASYNVFPLTSREIKPELAEPARQSPEKARIIFNQVIYDKRRIDEEYSREANKAFTESELNVLAKIKEAELIAHAILENDPAQERLASFGILIRSYTRINFLLETLKKFNIAYSFVMKRGLLDQPEVNIFISLLKVIYRTSSPLDLPIFAEGKIRGLQSSLLTGEFAERGFILTAYTVFHSPLFQDYLKSLVNYHEALDVIRILLAELSKIARQWGDHPFHALHRAERMGMEMGMESFRDNAVRIMTIHSAKGLEFDQLFLVNLSGRENADRAAYSFINQVMDQEQNWIDFSIRRGKDLLGRQLFQSMMAGDYQRRNQAFEERETANLLYVALTRARDNIFVSMLKNNINAKSSLSVNMLRNLDFNLFREQNWDLPSSAREVTLPGVEDKIHLHRIDISEINFFSEKPIPENKTSIMLEKEVAGFFYQRMRPEIRAVSQIVSEAQKDAAAEKNLPQPDFQDTEVSETMEAQWRETGKISEKVNPREVGNFVHAFLEKNLKQMVSGKFDFDGAFQIFQDEHPYRSRAFYLLAGKMARRVMQAKEFFDLMQDGANLYFESPILFQTSADGRFAFGVMDLLIEKKNELIILDYKTHEKAGENSAELREKYRKQLELYEQGLSRICPEKSIRKFLLHITEKKAELENI
jgi:ATP-dependent exoDNAse (exonuclease V) beta subunit